MPSSPDPLTPGYLWCSHGSACDGGGGGGCGAGCDGDYLGVVSGVGGDGGEKKRKEEEALSSLCDDD